MVGLLTALQNTQLTRRLGAEGRLRPFVGGSDQCNAGLNFLTLRPRRDVLSDFKAVLENAYRPAAYFGRVRAVGRALNCPNHAMGSFKELSRDLLVLGRLAWRMTVKMPELRRHFWGTLADCARHNISALEHVITLMVFYLHLGPFARDLIRDLTEEIKSLDRQASGHCASATRNVEATRILPAISKAPLQWETRYQI
jgi:hypothetical protein